MRISDWSSDVCSSDLVRTPGRVPLEMPTAGLAEAVAHEWRAQGETIDPRTMPLTSLASTVVDRVRPLRAGVTEQLLRFAETDLVCYRADAPPELVARQDTSWQPLTEWLKQRFGARLTVVCGVVPERQPDAAIRALEAALAARKSTRLKSSH